ncbi:MAG: hypothetical protein JO016_08300 [Actinobacteria bacterium]|nr:hypothetical protein [Actinomycetota bacterium]
MTTRTTTPARTAPSAAPPGRLTVFAVLTGLTALAIFLQAVTAGEFVSQPGRDSWVTVHGVIADVSWGLALGTALYAAITLRRVVPRLVLAAAVLFVLTLAQTGIGHLITDDNQNGWIAVHVPLAFVIFGLTLWLAVRAALARRAAR